MHIDFLDGYRGVLSYWVFMTHVQVLAKLNGDYEYFMGSGYFIGVIGFFLLSSFLLTFRLLQELKKDGDDLIPILLIFLKYFIRRFFRIYIPFALFCTLVKFASPMIGGGSLSWNETSYSQLLSLNHNISTHLWTIPPEIKYYFFIPVFVLASHLFNKNALVRIFWITSLAIILAMVEYFNLFGNQFRHNNFSIHDSNLFLTRFTTFFLGSLLALIISFIHEWEMYKNYESSKYFKLFFGTASMVLYLAGMVLFSLFYNKNLNDRYYFRCSVYWALFLCLFVLGGSNYFTDLFKFRLFSYGGKISFGFYLYHVGVIDFIFDSFGKSVKLKFEIIVYSFIVAFAIGFLHYLFVEKNLIKLANLICKCLENLSFFKRKLYDMAFYQRLLKSIDKAKCKLISICSKKKNGNELI